MEPLSFQAYRKSKTSCSQSVRPERLVGSPNVIDHSHASLEVGAHRDVDKTGFQCDGGIVELVAQIVEIRAILVSVTPASCSYFVREMADRRHSQTYNAGATIEAGPC